jgi:hypothetical protein
LDGKNCEGKTERGGEGTYQDGKPVARTGLPSWYRRMVGYFFFLATFFLAFFLAATQLTSDQFLGFIRVC